MIFDNEPHGAPASSSNRCKDSSSWQPTTSALTETRFLQCGVIIRQINGGFIYDDRFRTFEKRFHAHKRFLHETWADRICAGHCCMIECCCWIKVGRRHKEGIYVCDKFIRLNVGIVESSKHPRKTALCSFRSHHRKWVACDFFFWCSCWFLLAAVHLKTWPSSPEITEQTAGYTNSGQWSYLIKMK